MSPRIIIYHNLIPCRYPRRRALPERWVFFATANMFAIPSGILAARMDHIPSNPLTRLFFSHGYVHMGGSWLNRTSYNYTSSTAQGGGGSFKNRKPIGKVGCCESGMAERIHWWWLMSPLFLSLSLTIYLPIYLSSMYLSIYLSIYRSIDLSIYRSIVYRSISLSLFFICLSVYLSSCLPVYLSIYLSVCLSVCLSLSLSLAFICLSV